MKGQIIGVKALDWHGRGFILKRLLIPEADNLAITLHHNNLYILLRHQGFGHIIKEIEVPDEFVQRVVSFIQTQDKLKSTFRTLMEMPPNKENGEE